MRWRYEVVWVDVSKATFRRHKQKSRQSRQLEQRRTHLKAESWMRKRLDPVTDILSGMKSSWTLILKNAGFVCVCHFIQDLVLVLTIGQKALSTLISKPLTYLKLQTAQIFRLNY